MFQMQFDRRLTMGNVITLAVLIVSVLYYFKEVESRVTTTENNICSIEERVERLEENAVTNQAAFTDLVGDITKIKGSQKNILKLNKLIADRMGIIYVIDVSED